MPVREKARIRHAGDLPALPRLLSPKDLPQDAHGDLVSKAIGAGTSARPDGVHPQASSRREGNMAVKNPNIGKSFVLRPSQERDAEGRQIGYLKCSKTGCGAEQKCMLVVKVQGEIETQIVYPLACQHFMELVAGGAIH